MTARSQLRRGATVAAALSAAGLGLALPQIASAGPGRAPACASPADTLLFRRGAVRVYRTPPRTERSLYHRGVEHYTEVYACWVPTGARRLVTLTNTGGPSQLRYVAARAPSGPPSPYLAYEVTASDGSDVRANLVSQNIRTGHFVHDNARDYRRFLGRPNDLTIASFSITPRGSLAWIGTGDCPGSTTSTVPVTGVYAIGPDGRERAEQCGASDGSGPALGGLSYDRGARRLSWRAAGLTKGAPLV